MTASTFTTCFNVPNLLAAKKGLKRRMRPSRSHILTSHNGKTLTTAIDKMPLNVVILLTVY